MQTQLNHPTQAPLPVTQVNIPLNQNAGTTNLAEDKKIKYFKKVVRGLGVRI